MPALPPVPGVLKVRFRFTLDDGSTAMVIWHMTYTGGAPSDANCATLASLFYTSWVSAMAGVTWSGTTFAGVDVTDLTSDTAGSGSHDGTSVGTYGTVGLGAQVAVLASMPIARRYRGGKPRSYWPVLAGDALTSSGQWASGEVSAVQTAVLALQSAMIGQSAGTTVVSGHVSISYYSGFTAVTNPVTGRTRDVPKVRTGAIPIDPILSIGVSSRPATQRRRTGRKR